MHLWFWQPVEAAAQLADVGGGSSLDLFPDTVTSAETAYNASPSFSLTGLTTPASASTAYSGKADFYLTGLVSLDMASEAFAASPAFSAQTTTPQTAATAYGAGISLTIFPDTPVSEAFASAAQVPDVVIRMGDPRAGTTLHSSRHSAESGEPDVWNY